MTTAPARLRSDAERNRVRILSAAAEVLAARGVDAGMDEIAERAGVGVGTIYRRFPTKEALVAAVATGLVDHLHDIAASATSAPPGEGFEHFLRGLAGLTSHYGRGLGRLYASDEARQRIRREIDPLVDRLIAEAKAAGRLRDEITRTDLGMLVWSVAGVVETAHDVAPQLWQRLLDVLLAGLRPTDEPLRRSALTRIQMDRIAASR